MHKNYTRLKRAWALLLVLAGLLLSGAGARAQSGPVGNEWIVPGQQYYKVKILKDGLYKLDYQYLTQAGIAGVAPTQLQLWRRGREMARYVGGNNATLDPTTFIEFYAVHNDARLDVELYKQAVDQPNSYYNFYTDTASYFITWSAARSGRAMSQPVAAGGAVHPHRLSSQLNLKVGYYSDAPLVQYSYLPWLEPAEGYFGTGNPAAPYFPSDSLIRNVALTGPAPQVEVVMYGFSDGPHAVEVMAVTPAGVSRSLGVMRWTGRRRMRQTFQFLRSDVSSTGRATIRTRVDASATAGDTFYCSYIRLVMPQLNRWFANRHSVEFQNDSLLAGPASYEFAADSIPATAVGFDVHDLYNVQRIVSTVGSAATRRFVFPDANATASHRLLLADEAFPAVPPVRARRVYFRTISAAVPTFIIITHPILMRPDPATGVTNAAREYCNYRASAAGGRYDTLMVTTAQLYDQFFYGDHSWLAMRHFTRWLAAATPNATNRFLLLLGKGIVPSEGGGQYRTGNPLMDLVPTSSRSVSDNMLTADFVNNDFRARLNTGRLTATTPAQVLAYLAKLRQHDLLRNDQNTPWRKNVLHLVGGEDASEFVDFRNNMNKYKQRVEQPLFGGKVVATIERTTTLGSQLVVNANISQYLNNGLSLISFLGHGSNTAFSLDIGDVNDTRLGYNNTGKYPVLMYNNCAAAHLFTVATGLFFENWLFAPNKGAIGGMGQYGFGFEGYLDPAQDTIYKLLFNDPSWYGKPITAVYNETVRRLQLRNSLFAPANNDIIATEQLLSTIWHGDPTIALYAPPKPDFQVSNATLSISPNLAAGQTAVSAAASSFLLNIGVTNPGKVTTEPVTIRVTRIFDSAFPPTPANSVTTYSFPQGLQGNATYTVVLPNPPGTNVFGNNTFRVELDYLNQVDESDETNNVAQTNFTFLRGGLTVLNPTEFAIVGNSQPRLVAQTNDPNGPQRVYEFEADTTTAFSSSLKRTSGPITATLTASWRPTLPSTGRDSTVWYWRVRFQTAVPPEDPNWVVSSFRVIQGRTAGGWSQSHYAQFRRDQRAGVEISVPTAAAPTSRWDFSTENKPLVLATVGGGLPGAASTFNNAVGLGIIANPMVPPTVANCAGNTPNLLIAVYNQRTLLPITGLPAPTVCGVAPQQFYIFGANPANAADTLNTLNNSATRQAQLTAFLAAVPDGSYVALVSMNRLRWPSLTTVRTAFSTLLGSVLVNQLQNGDPFALVAQKRASGGQLLHEAGPTASTPPVPRYLQTITLNDTLRTPSTRGTITSTRIGPAQSWEKLYQWIQREPGATSSYTLKVIGIDTLNNATVLFANVPAASPQRGGFSLSTVSAVRYPYLQLELAMKDSLNRTAPQLKEWFITYQGVPEGVVRRDLVTPGTAYDPATLAAQAATTGSLTIPVVFENVTPFNFGTPLKARVEVTGGQPGTAPISMLVTAPRQLKGDSTIIIRAVVPFVGRFGTFTAKVTVNPTPHPLPEVNLFNNELNLAPFSVIDNNLPPTLDVAFDGRHILNGELVSPSPVINIQLSDEDKLRHITDASFFTVTLLRPGQTVPSVVNVTGSDVIFSVNTTNGSLAKLEYHPDHGTPLPDGVYTLRVQGRDPSNANAGSQDFQVKFEVVNASKITNVYPYPNPVINKARFVFTVTGQELPRDMKIQIMTLTGRVVREIFMNELGPLHIGNNITDFAWDGTDSYGDRLANGTYLYRVSLDDPNGQFGRRDTAGDKAFKNDWGKLVLMR